MSVTGGQPSGSPAQRTSHRGDTTAELASIGDHLRGSVSFSADHVAQPQRGTRAKTSDDEPDPGRSGPLGKLRRRLCVTDAAIAEDAADSIAS